MAARRRWTRSSAMRNEVPLGALSQDCMGTLTKVQYTNLGGLPPDPGAHISPEADAGPWGLPDGRQIHSHREASLRLIQCDFCLPMKQSQCADAAMTSMRLNRGCSMPASSLRGATHMGSRLAGRRVAVTCATQFMGPAICEVFEEEGATVIADNRDLREVDAAAALIKEA